MFLNAEKVFLTWETKIILGEGCSDERRAASGDPENRRFLGFGTIFMREKDSSSMFLLCTLYISCLKDGSMENK